jgi:hypothetical protein
MDLNVTPKYDVPKWNETRWNGCWNPEQGVGIYLHMGRYRYDLDMWWAQIVAYLPDQELVVQKLWGRSTHGAGVGLDGFELAMTENGWTSTFDGVCELTNITALAAAPRGSSAPLRSVRWDLTATEVTPTWDMYAETGGERLDHAGDAHVQGAFETTGSITVGGQEFRLDGVGFKDHSSGVRDFAVWHSHTFLVIVHPEWTAQLIVMRTPEGEDMAPWGVFWRRDGSREPIKSVEFPIMNDAYGGPVHSDLVFDIGTGQRFEYDVELVHALPMTITEENDNINGVDWGVDGDPVIIVEGKGKLTAPGEPPVYCFHERSVRRSMLSPVPGALESAAAAS